MSIYKLAYNFKSVKASRRIASFKASSLQEAEAQLLSTLWWDCIDPSEVWVNFIGKSPAA